MARKVKGSAKSTRGVSASAKSTPRVPLGERVRPWLLATLAALCVARPLMPSEGAAWIGDGQPMVMGWLGLAVLYFLYSAIRGSLLRQPDMVDAAVGVLVAITTLSCYQGMAGNPRACMNMLGEWLALGLVFFLTRQLVQTSREARALVAVMIALALVQSGYGFYQYYVSLPADRAAYAVNPELAIERAGQSLPKDSSERENFEHRLMSTEPFGTFALTNSLAGFLAPWLVILSGICYGLTWSDDAQLSGSLSTRLIRAVGLATCALSIMYCLLLTKSRSALLALFAGLPLLSLAEPKRFERFPWKAAGVAAGALALLVAVALAAGGLDAPVFTQAAKSLGYRWEYWRSTFSMIGYHPWLGVAPGSFVDYYTQFKLPQASEEIRDPHNFLLEIWATAGSFAFVVFLSILMMFVGRAWKAHEAVPTREGDSSTSTWFILGGGAAGFGAAFIIGPIFGWFLSEEHVLLGLLAFAVVIGLLWSWIGFGDLTSRLLLVAWLVQSINFLAAGGISFPGVAGTFWMLMALGLNQAEGAPSSVAVPGAAKGILWRPRVLPVAGLVLSLVAAAACFYYACQPVVRFQSAMADVDAARRAKPDSSIVPALLMEAAQVDPWAPEPWSQLAELAIARLEAQPELEAPQGSINQTLSTMLSLRARSPSLYRLAGRATLLVVERNQSAEAAEAAVDIAKRAVAFYPNSALVRGEYALALEYHGEHRLAKRQAEAAQRLDEQMPHADKKISAELVARLQEIIDAAVPQEEEKPETNASQPSGDEQ